MEFWTIVRFTLYPIMLVAGTTWAVFQFRQYRRQRCAEAAWSGWLALAVAVQGASGFAALLISNAIGFGSLSSAIFTLGPLAVTLVVSTAAVAMLWLAWKHS